MSNILEADEKEKNNNEAKLEANLVVTESLNEFDTQKSRITASETGEGHVITEENKIDKMKTINLLDMSETKKQEFPSYANSKIEKNMPCCSSANEDSLLESRECLVFHYKNICMKETFFRIIMQNTNGPCPLIAISNVLILKRLIEIPSNENNSITSQVLIDILFNYLLNKGQKNDSSENSVLFEESLAYAFVTIPKMIHGLDMNVKFSDVRNFEFTDSLAIFDIFGIPLYHCWLPDPQDTLTYSLLHDKSYNQVIENYINCSTSEDSDKHQEALLINEFLNAYKSQITYYGLFELNHQMKDDEISILFLNNHFCTIIKRENQINMLVTDLGMKNEELIVWETLVDIDGNNEFLDDKFQRINQKDAVDSKPQSGGQFSNIPDYTQESQYPAQNIAYKERQKKSLRLLLQSVVVARNSSSSAFSKTLAWNFKDTASINEILDLLVNGDRSALSKTITLLESSRQDHREKSKLLLDAIMRMNHNLNYDNHDKSSYRIGLTGPPGAGKSTFIEKFGMKYLNGELGTGTEDNYLAVLAIDPSSMRTGGSLLGDKTRMTELSYHPRAFIRPSCSGNHLGGVSRSTNENILLCEAAKFNTILVETVGVGQSEYSVSDMVDLFVLIIPPAGGDELQGIKKGIIEYVDIVLVNKSDGDLLPAARRVAGEYKSALKYSHSRHKGWSPKVIMISSETGHGIDDFWKAAGEFKRKRLEEKEFFQHRQNQILNWMNQYITDGLWKSFRSHPNVVNSLGKINDKVKAGQLTPGSAADLLIREYTKERVS